MSVEVVKILTDCRAGRVQTVANMQVIPLISDVEFNEFTAFGNETIRTSSVTYGTIRVKNITEKPVIVPASTAFVVKKRAQDHALCNTRLVPAGETIEDDTAACVQDSQGGTYGMNDEVSIRMLPLTMRENLFNQRNTPQYSKLWANIKLVNSISDRVSHDGHIVEFYRAFDKQLEGFIASFEPVPGQIGAIVLIDGKVVGIERTPSHAYWLSVWRMIIRDCYGQLAIPGYYTNAACHPDRYRAPLNLSGANDIADVQRALESAQDREKAMIDGIVSRILAMGMSASSETAGMTGISVESLSNDEYVGQLVKSGHDVVYASIIARMSKLSAKGSGADSGFE